MKIFFPIVAFICLFSFSITAQEGADSIEVYLIDAYVKPELPHTFILSFFTSEPCKSTVVMEDKYSYEVSDELTDMHNFEMDISSLRFSKKIVNFIIICQDSVGRKSRSEIFDFDLPYEPEIEGGSDIFQLCLFGGAIFLLPYPNYMIQDRNHYFSLTKDIPILSFRSKSLNYPASYISVEYSHILKANVKNYLRMGYKQIYEIPHIEYLSPGITLYTNFLGNNGIGLEVSAGFFTIADSFTFYTRYRYNVKLAGSAENFQEISIGLYSAFFSLYLK